jgi:hypothetical protein
VGARTANATPLLACPLTWTTTFPLVAATGTIAKISVGLQNVIEVAVAPLNVTVLAPWDEPKLVPVIVTPVLTALDVGDRPLIEGAVAYATPGAQNNMHKSVAAKDTRTKNMLRVVDLCIDTASFITSSQACNPRCSQHSFAVLAY